MRCREEMKERRKIHDGFDLVPCVSRNWDLN